MKTYIPITFLAGFGLSESFGSAVSGAWVLLVIVTLTALGALAWCYLEGQNDTGDAGSHDAQTIDDLNPLWDLSATWKRE